MRNRLRSAGLSIRRAAAFVGAVVSKVIGPGELMLTTGLGLVAVALWPAIGRLALLPTALVLIWIGLPTRHVFVLRPQVRKTRRTVRWDFSR